MAWGWRGEGRRSGARVECSSGFDRAGVRVAVSSRPV